MAPRFFLSVLVSFLKESKEILFLLIQMVLEHLAIDFHLLTLPLRILYLFDTSENIFIFNIFMNVVVTPTGVLLIHPPHSKAGDEISFLPEMDLIVGKPIEWEVMGGCV